MCCMLNNEVGSSGLWFLELSETQFDSPKSTELLIGASAISHCFSSTASDFASGFFASAFFNVLFATLLP